MGKKGEEIAVASFFEGEAGQGFENVDSNSFAIPFLKILQKLSPQCDEDKAQYMPDAKPGMLLNTVTGELFDTAIKEVFLIPCFYDRNFTKWKPKSEGGGFKGTEKPTSRVILEATQGEHGLLVSQDGLEMADTRYHYCILQCGDNYAPVLVTMSSTQTKKSKAWMSMMNGIKITGSKGKFTPPTFSHKYKVTTVTETKDDNSWKGWKIEIHSILTEADADIYNAAKLFRDQIAAGTAKVEHGAPDINDMDADDDSVRRY